MSVFDFSLFAKGGPIMWVLLALGLLCLMLCIERTLYLHRGQIRSTAFIGGIKNILAKRRIVEALTVCEETPGPVAAVVKAALLHADDDADTMRFHVQEAAIVELPSLERRLGSIAAIAQVAPLVGLLGTVLGFITTFVAFDKDYATASALSKGMWQALLCTAGGLMLAIPAHLAHHFLSGRVRAIVRDVEWAENEIMKYLLTDYRGGSPEVAARAASPANGRAGGEAMITRPLDLASKLRTEPRSLDALFYVNVGALVLFFSVLGSRFVLAPGLDIKLATTTNLSRLLTTSTISVKNSGQIFADGLLSMPQLREWLKIEAKKYKNPSLLIRMSAGVPISVQSEIVGAAAEAGFSSVTVAAEEPAPSATLGR